MYKSKRQKNKSFDWYGLSQRFSIRKYHFGAASVLLGTALILGAAQTTAKAEEATTENKTEAVTSAPKDDKASENVTNVTTPALSATTGAAVVEKPALSDEEVAKLAAEASKKDEKASEAATTEKTEAADKEKVILTPATDKKADKKDEKKAENPITATKTVLEQLTSEAEVLNTTASNFADKKAEDKAGKEAIAAAVASAKVQIEASKKALAAGENTKEELDAQLQRISSAIEAVYATMKRAGHKGELKGLLDGTTGTTTGARDLAPKVLTPVTNPESLTDSEIAAIEKEIRTSNPGLTKEDTITVQKTRGVQGAGFTTITYADGSGSVTFEPGQVMVASAGIKNLEQLSSSINWFNFASATITYKDGTVASPVRYYEDSTTIPGGRLYKQLDKSTGSTGRTFEGYFSMYRDVVLGRDYTVDGVLYTKGTRLKSTDDAFLKMGIAKYEQHIYYSGNLQGQTDVKIPNAGINPTTYTTKSLGEIYEVLQLGMKFDVPTRVEGYKLSATVSKLAPKEVEQDPQKGQGNRLRYYTSGDNGNSKAYGPTRVYDIVDAQNGGGRDVDVLLTTQDKTNSYLRTAGIHTNYRERREGDSDTNPTGPIREGLVAFSSSRDHANFGVSLYLEATYNGQLVPVNAVVADADESGRREYSQFETDGGAWEKLMEIHWDNRRLDSKGDAIVDGNGTSVLVDKNGNPYVDAAGNPMFINNKQTPTREDVVENDITEAKYYLTTASGAKVLVAEKDHMPVLDADGNPTILDSTGTRMTTTKEGLFRSTEVDRNGIKIKTREILDAEGRPILQGSAAMKGLEAFILPSGVKTFEIEYIGDPAKRNRRYFDTTDGKHEEIKKDFYGRSIMWGSEVDGRLAKEGGDDRATLKFKNPDKRPVQLANAGDLGDMKDAGYDPKQWVSSSAYGDKTFGSFWDAREDGYRLPIGLTQGVSNLSFYGNSTSSVSGVVGFIVTDGGDAPKSYGSAKHVIGNFNKVINNQEVTATQPYLGDQPGDPDFRSTVNEKSGDWVLDDLVMTNKYIETSLGAGETDPTKQVQVTNQKGDTGTFIITSSGNAVIRQEDGSQVAINQGDVLTTPDPKTGLPLVGIYNSTTQKLGVGAIPDEGEAQLLDPDAVDGTGKKIKGEYTLRQASDTEYVLYGVKANPGVNNKEAYLYGWVDFNGNGQFDKDERSELIKVTPGQKTYDVKFKNIAQLLDTSIDKAGVRLRIALEEQDIRESTGLAGSGEVEDFQTFVTHFPRGTRHETKDYQGQEQTIKVPTNAMFIANGKSKDSGYKNWAQINNVELSPKIVLTDKIVNSNTVTTLDPNAEKDKTDLGTKGIISSLRKKPDGSIYTNAEGKVFIDKKDATVLSGKLVQVKDKNNKVLGTALEVVNPNNNKTEYLMSEYTEYDSVGNKVGIYKINPATAGDNKEVTGGFYETTVTFKPEIGYVGRAKGIAIRAWDDNNNSTGWEASTQTIAASAASTTLADKDKINGNVNDGVNNYKSMDTIYVPTVIDIKPVGKDETTIDEQGKKQSASPKIPDHGTVESINNEHIDEAKIDKAHVLIDKTKPITFSEVKNIPGKLYEVDTPVDKETTLTYEDGGTETFKPVDKVPAGTIIAENRRFEITGSGNVEVSNVRIIKGTLSNNLVPAGSVLEGAAPIAPKQITVIRNGQEVTVNAGERIQKGDQLVTPLPVEGPDQHTIWKVTFQKGDTIPQATGGYNPKLVSETSVDKLIGTKGDSITLAVTENNQKVNKTFVNNNNIIPKGTRTAGQAIPLTNLTLPKATHVNPTTGEVTTVERRYSKIDIDNGVIEIENEGRYEIKVKEGVNEKGEKIYEDATVVFTPHPSFVGVGTGVTIKQPDVDYDNPDATDSVRRRYGTDYGYATYTPTVTPNLTATITRKIHYVYEGDASVPPQDKTPILTIDDKPVVNEQTLTYNRDYIVMEKDGATEKDIKVANAMTLDAPITIKRVVTENNQAVEKEITTNTLQPGDEVKAGTQLKAGTVIIGAWKPINDENAKFTPIISPVLKGYTAEVQLPATEYTKKDTNGVQTHVRNANNTPAGIYTPSAPGGTVDTVNVGAYEPLVSVVRADDQDNFDVYVYYKADKQKANVVYIDLDEKGDKRVLETQSGTKATELPTGTTQDPKTTYGVEKLSGESASTIPYDTADTIKKYTDKGYELAYDDYKNDEKGKVLAEGRKFDEDSSVDQTFYVYLRHKKEQLSTNDKRTVTRHIEYKYADTTDVPADKRGQHVEEALAKTVTEVLTFERTRTLDMATTAKLFENEYNAYKAVLANNAVGSDAEVDARATLFKFVQGEVNKPTATDEVKLIISFGEWQAKPGTGENITLSAAEKTIKDSKFNDVVSPTVPGYLPDNAKVEATADVNPESDPDDYTVTVTYSPGDQKAIVNFVEVDANDSNQVITPGLADPVTITGKSGAAFPTTTSASVQAKIDELVKKGYELVDNGNGFVATDSFDTNADVDQTYTVKLRAKTAPVVPTDNVTPVPGQPVDPNNPTGPKWPESVKNLVNKDTVKRTIKYVYEDGTPVIDPATGAQKVVEQTAEFTRPANVNLVTGDITYGPWTPAEGTDLVAVTSPTSTDIPAVAKYVPSTATVPVVKVQAGQDDITETVVYRKANPVTVQPNDPTPTKDQPIDPNNTDPNAPKWTEELLKKLEDARSETVTRTITYKYSDVATDLKADDAAKAGTDVKENVTVTNTVTFKRPVTIDPQTGEFTYGDWVATNGTTLAGKADLPVVAGYVATGDVEASKKDVEVKATDKDITDKVVYKALGKFVPVVPEGFTPPTIENPQYPNNNDDPSKPGTPTTTIPYVPGTTPVGPDGQPLKPKVEGDPKQGYVPPAPTTPTGDTTILYVKDGSQVAVVHFVDEKGNSVNESVIETGDTGGTISTTKADAVKTALEAKGYEVVAPTDALYTTDKEGFYKEADRKFDAVSDKATGAAGEKVPSQQYYVIVKAKELPVVPTKPVNPNNEPVDPTDPTTPNKPRDPETTVTPKPTDPVPNDPKGRTYGELGLVEQVTRTIDYVYDNGTKVEEDKLGTAKDERTKTLTFTRNAKINAVTGEVTYLDANGNATTKELAPWTPATTDTFNTVNSPVIDTYVLLDSNQKTITGERVAATDNDIAHKVVYKKAGSIKPQIPAGVTPLTPATDTPYSNNPQDPSGVLKPDPTKPTDPTQPNGPTTPVIPEVTGYTPYGPNGKPLEKDPNGGYKVPDLPTDPTQDTPIVYVKNGEQLAITKFVDVNGNGLAPSVVDSGDEGTNFTKDGDVTATINAILARGYEKVANVNATEKEYPTEATDKVFDKDASTNQEFTVTFKPIVKEVPVDPATPGTKPQPGQPVDPGNPDGPKWPNSVKDLKNTDTVKRTIKYVYEDGTPVIDPATGAQKVVEQTAEFTRTANVNLVTGDITYGDWTPAKELAAVASPTATDIPAVANYIVSTATVPAVTVAAEADDITETVVYRQAKPVTITPDAKVPDPEDPNTPADNPIQPNKPIDPNNPEGPKWTKELIDKLRAAREETVTRTITYKYSTETSELKAEDAAKAGQTAADTVTNSVTFKRPVTIDPVTKEFTYGDWVADNNDTTLEGKADLPVVAGYVATGDVEGSKKDVTDVKATDKDITENVVYKTVGKYVPVIPDGITPPANTNVDPKPYNNDPQDGSKVKDPDPTNPVVPGTTTPIVPQIPGTTPVGPDGKPLKPVDSNDLSKGYVPPTPTDPTKDTSIIYVKDGSQVAVVHFVDEKGNSVNESVVETGDTGNTISTTKADAVKKALEAKGYEVVAPTDALYTADKEGFYKEADRKFDAVSDKATGAADEKVPSQQYYVIVKAKDLPVDPTKPVDPNNNPVDPTNPTPENPTKPRDPETPVTPKPEDKVPNDPKGRTYGELGLVEQVTRTINYVKNDGSKAAEPVKETLTFTRKAKINAVTGEVTYLAADGVTASTKEDAPWTPVNGDKFTEKVSPAVPNYTPTVEKVAEKTGVTATDEDIVETVVYNPTKQTVDPNAPKDPSTPDVTPKPNDVVPNDPKGRTYKELGLIEEVTRTVHYVYEDGTKAAEDKVQTITFTRTAEIDTVTGAISNFGTWTLKDENNTFEPETTEAKAGYVASAAKSTEVTGVQATDKDTEETIIYRKLGSYVPVVPAGVTPPANFDKTPKPYPNATPEDPTRPGTPTTPTTTIPEIPGTTPVGPDGTPLTKNPNGGYDLPPVPADPTQNTTITYVKDGSQVAVVHFVDEKGRAVNESVVETGDTGKEISKSNVDSIKAKLEAKGYTVVEPTDALYTTDKEGFYKEATRTFDAVSDKSTGTAGEKVPSQQYYVIVKAKDLPVDPTKPLDPNNNPVDPTNPTPENPTKPRDPETPVTPKPEDKVPNDPKGRTYGELGLVEQVTRTINYVKNDGSKAAEPVKETLTFTRKAKINAVTGEVTYLAADGVTASTKEDAPWTPVNGDKFTEKVSPAVPNYTPTVEKVAEKTGVTATDEDIVETVVYNPTKQTVDPNAPKDPSTPDVTPKPNDVVPNDPKGRTYKELGLIEEVTRTVHYVYEDGTKAAEDKVQTITFTRTAEIDTVTGAISNFGTWTLKDENNTFEPETTEAKAGYVASAAKSTEVTGVQATDKDTEETIIYRKLGSYVPVVPAGVTPPANFDKTPKPYPNATPEDPTRPGTPTTPTTTIPEIPGTTPVGPDGTPLTKNPNGGYDLPPVPADPTQNTTITYVKDGSQVAVVHFVDEKGRAVNESVVETGDTGKEISKSNVDSIKAKLEAKGYTVVEPTDALYTTDKEGFYKEATRTFDAVSDKSTGTAGEKVPSQQYYVIVKAKEIPADPTKPGTTPGTNPNNPTPGTGTPTDPKTPENGTPTPGTDTPAKPTDKIPGDPLNRTYGDLGLVEEVTRTINYVKNDGTKAADPVKETLTFTRKAKINAVTGEVTYLAADGVTPVASKDDAPWTAANGTEFKAVKSPTGAEKPELANYTPSKAEVEAKTGVTATDEDIVETVVYNPAKVTVTPNDPNVDPEKPLNPNDPNGLKYKDLKLTEEVKRTITYTYADDVADTSKRGTDAAPKHETTVSFTRTATVNQATGEVTYGDWTAVNNDTTLEGKTELPVIPGYVATGDVESVKKDVANVSATDKDIVEKVVYKDLGKYVPVVPDGTTPPTITDPKYPNNPTDPTKPGEPTTTIPNVPGLTPLDPSTGKPLEPKDPNDLTKGYKPPVPQDPSKDTNIVYVADGSQVTVVHFVDEDGNAVHTSFVEAGDAGAKFTKAGEVTKVVEELKAAGYAVVPNKAGQAEYPGEAGVFDSVDDKGKDGVSQVYYVTVAKTVPVTPTNPENPNEDPKNPKPGDPIDPNKPDGPKWTEDALNKLNNIKSVTRTITYVKDGTDEEVSTTEAPKVTNKVSFTRTAIVNPKDGSVVGYDTNGDGKVDVPATDTTTGWTAAGTAKFAEVKSPVVKGYVVKPNQDTQGDLVEADGSKVKASTTDLTVDSPNQDLKVRYVPVGTWTPKVPDGETPIDPIPYPNDPKDPGKVVDPNKPTDPNDPNKPSVPVVPHIPGTTPKDPNGNPLKPVDPEDPSKGYVPPTPTTPTENTVIEYVKDDQKAVTKFVDPSGNPIPGVNNIEEKGKSGEPLTKATEVANEIAKLIAKGYELVSNNYGKDNNGNFDKDSGKDQEYTVVLTPHVEPIKPFDPTNPNDPNKPKPGTPIDPNNPDGPKWTEELIKSLETTKHVTRTISYVDKDGNKVEYTDKDGNKSTADVTDKVTFTREAKINLVTGAIEYGKWTPVNNDTTFDKVTSPVVPGYVLKDPAQKEVAETTGLTENSKDENIKVVYVPVGRLVPKVPNGVTPPTPTPYDNDPQDPGKVVPPSPTKPQEPQDPNSPKVPVIPHIPGTTPKVPQDPTKPVDPNTNPLVPLKPVDPKDPSKGYEVPPVPTNPGTDTPIVYENDKQKAITNFVDNNGKVVSDPVVDQGDSGSKFTKNGEVEDKIKELLKKGYIVTSNDYPSADTDRVFDNDKDKDQIFNVKVTPLIVPTDPNSPDKPQVPTDPTKPVGPNNPLKPVTPSNPEPGKPVFPEDPNSPVWPETVKDLVTESSATRTITYVDRNGKEVAATHTETIKFKRTAKVNLVTGDITYGEWTVVGDDTILNGNPLPSVKGYIARGGDIKESQEDIKAEAGKNITQTVVYAKLGSWIPRLPEGQTNVPPTPYPNDPTDPTKPGTDKPKVPYVPGFIPVDPNGNPLKPVDPNDPTKGYEVPDVPADPTQDTPIKYIPVPTPNNGGGNNGGGGGNTPTPQPQPNPTPQPEPSPAPNPVPVTPETPEQPVAPVTPEQPAEPATPQYMDGQRELPNTGTEAHSSLAALGLLGALSGFGLIARKKRKDEE